MKKGSAPILIIGFVVAIIVLVVWAPWVTNDFAYKKAVSLLDASCRELKRDEYQPKIINPMWVRPTLQQMVGLDPLFGNNTSVYVICSDKASHNYYFVSFYGSVNLTKQENVILKK